jgi:hypothetical protein
MSFFSFMNHGASGKACSAVQHVICHLHCIIDFVCACVLKVFLKIIVSTAEYSAGACVKFVIWSDGLALDLNTVYLICCL